MSILLNHGADVLIADSRGVKPVDQILSDQRKENLAYQLMEHGRTL